MLFLLLICFLLGVATGNQYTRAVYPMIIEERTEDGTVVLHVHDGLSLSLTKAKVATEALRLRSRIDGREIDQIVNGTEIERNLFEDRQKMATVSLIKASDGVRVSGLLSPSERIETAFYDARQASGRIPHIVRNIQRPFGSRPLSMDRRKDLFIRRCHESYLPGNITIEVYVVSDVIHNRRFTEEDLLIYICVFMNSINAIFMSLTCPSVRVALVGLEKSDQSDEYGYVYGSENLMNMYSLYTFKDYVRKRMHKYGNPDVVLLLTGRDVYESVNGGISRDITGIAFEGGVCTDSCVALAEDVPGSFSGITDAAHELGHSLRGQKCWNINADVFFSVKDVYPGALINPTDFCRRFYKNNEVYSPREPFVRSHCKMRCCAVLRPNTLTCSLHHMLDHTWCDYGKKCFQGVCTGGENSSPYQSKKFSRKH
uniref:Reprolysin n=1 Tax=Rhipicephalus zambeziensis TaxID=60191 RepID=A0A224YGC6_9ACAR